MINVGAAGWLILYPKLKPICEQIRDGIITSGSCSFEPKFRSEGTVSDPTFNKAMSLNVVYDQYRWCQIIEAVEHSMTPWELQTLNLLRGKLYFPVSREQLAKLPEPDLVAWCSMMDKVRETQRNHGKFDV